jgi:hypothetical protein
MFIAKDLRKKNIGAYLIYMFQIEDLIRACKCDNSIIASTIANKYNNAPVRVADILEWYHSMTVMMLEEKVQETGHLNVINHQMVEVFDFHLYMLENPVDFKDYVTSYEKVQDYLYELTTKSPEKSNIVKLLTESVYGVLLLKLSNKPISTETMQTINALNQHLNLLSDYFLKYEKGELAIGHQE